jgi:hypothetical protein
MALFLKHHSPHVGNIFGIPATIYRVNVGHSFLWCPYFLHVVHQMNSHLSFCFGLAGTLISSNAPSTLRWMDMSSDIGFLIVARLPAEPLPMSKTFVVAVDILSVVIVN